MKGYLHTFLDLQQEPWVVQRASNAVGGDCHGMATTFTERGRSNYSPLPVVLPLTQNGDYTSYNNLGTRTSGPVWTAEAPGAVQVPAAEGVWVEYAETVRHSAI